MVIWVGLYLGGLIFEGEFVFWIRGWSLLSVYGNDKISQFHMRSAHSPRLVIECHGPGT